MPFTGSVTQTLAQQEAAREAIITAAKAFENYMCTLNPGLIPSVETALLAAKTAIDTVRT